MACQTEPRNAEYNARRFLKSTQSGLGTNSINTVYFTISDKLSKGQEIFTFNRKILVKIWPN